MKTMAKSRVKVRELIAAVAKVGCAEGRMRGSHQTWSSPRGKPFTLVVNHKGHDADPKVVRTVTRILREEGIELCV